MPLAGSAFSESLLHVSPHCLLSIGMAVHNGEKTLKKAIDSILGQSFHEFELIISDNQSTDGTEKICREYAKVDRRIRYIRQPFNIGAAQNFKFVFEQAGGDFFMWAACDDVRSPDFLNENVNFLESNPDYVASTCPNCFEGQVLAEKEAIRFSIVGDMEERFHHFFDHCWDSHGIFYSVIRTDVLRECEIPGQSFTAADWAIDLFLASRGNIHRTERGMAVFGLNGISSRVGAWRAFRNQPIEWLLPFYRLTRYVIKLSAPLPLMARLRVLRRMLSLNMKAAFDQSHSALYQFYCAHVKSRKRASLG